MTPDLAPGVEIQLFGETHILKYGFRAFHELGVNPFDADAVKAFEEAPKSCMDLAKQVHAGTAHEYSGRNAARKGQPRPTIDDVLDELDPTSYVEILLALARVKGLKSESEAEADADPPKA